MLSMLRTLTLLLVAALLLPAPAHAQKKKKGAPRWIETAYDTIFLLSDGVPSMGV